MKVTTVRYDGFGNVVAETAPGFGGSYGWTGRVYEREVGLQYNRARFYDPGTGSWMSEDPKGFDAGDSNLHRYVGNDPTNATDPSGLEPPPFPNPPPSIPSFPPTPGTYRGTPQGGEAGTQFFVNILKKASPNPNWGALGIVIGGPGFLQAFQTNVVDQALLKLLAFGPAKDVFDAANKQCDGKIKVVVVGGIPASALWDQDHKEIQINPVGNNVNVDSVTSSILFEVLNAKKAPEYEKIRQGARRGDIGRADFILQIELLEYQNIKDHNKIARRAVFAGVWDLKCNEYENHLMLRPTFAIDIRESIREGHAQRYGEFWDRRFRAAWFQKHPGGDLDDPATIAKWRLHAGIIAILEGRK